MVVVVVVVVVTVMAVLVVVVAVAVAVVVVKVKVLVVVVVTGLGVVGVVVSRHPGHGVLHLPLCDEALGFDHELFHLIVGANHGLAEAYTFR